MKLYGSKTGKKYTLEDLLEENKRRNSIVFANYDPITGEGSLIPRKEININGQIQRWPVRMFDLKPVQAVEKYGVTTTAKNTGVPVQSLIEYLHMLRIKYDYEYWAFTCASIKNDKGEVIPFKFNLSQRKSIADRERLRSENKPVWQLEVKDRQYGSSTEKNAYIFWLQNIVYKNHNSYIISLDKDVVIDIVDRYERIASNYPPYLPPISFRGYRGARNTLKIDGRESFIYLGSVERPNAPSGRTVQHVLISEAGKMKETEVKSAEELLTNIVSLVPEKPYTTLLIESTAHQSGRWFRNESKKAMRGESGYCLTFINWTTNHEKWVADFQIRNKSVEVAEFVESLSDYNWTQWERAGASLEQINWYNIREKKYPNTWQMKQENPTWIDEAFQTKEGRYFPVEYVKNLEKYVEEPIAIGNIYSDASSGKDAFTNIRFQEEKEGRIWIWQHPDEIAVNTIHHAGMKNQCAAFADVGGRAPTSDKCAMTILNRFWMLEGGLPEVVAEYRGNLDLDVFAWEAAKLAYWYHQAELAIEVNTIINKMAREGTYEGDGSLTILNEINHVYKKLYARRVHDNRDSGRPIKKLGFHMNRATKKMVYDGLLAAARDLLYVERSSRAVHEINNVVQTPDGKIQAAEGEFDDLADTRAGGFWLATSHMPPPELIPRNTQKRRRDQVKSEAHI